MDTEFIIKLQHIENLPTNDKNETLVAFTGFIKNMSTLPKSNTDYTKDGYVMGIKTHGAKIKDGELIGQSLDQIVMLPNGLESNMYDVVCNLRMLVMASLGDALYLRSNKREVIVLISDTFDGAIPYMQWLLLKECFIIVYLPQTKNDINDNEEQYMSHGLFRHGTFKARAKQVIIRHFSEFSKISDDVLSLTMRMGVSGIVILPNAVTAFETEQAVIHRTTLLAAGIGCRIVWHEPLEQLDPCECESLCKMIVLEHINALLSSTDTEARRNANNFLMQWQQTVDAWSQSHVILHGNFPMEAKLIAAQTMRIKVMYDFYQLPPDQMSQLCESILSYLRDESLP
ncbi:bifunctional Armadillo-like helical/Armadillo-type fold [Babesia duncani]|uniref:Bifunctional Armadillo-like helical/Armadillo-type fold n=1 Tax=Babesia duncani TaxID=323732 RepID=A0AAD9UN75_9APIC|nr:bifunctional Armadillo-like helical/Armadillo-type fold [Babesia duncani]